MPAQTKATGRPPSTSTHWSRHERPSRPSPTPSPHRHPGLPAVAARALAGDASQRLHARHRSPRHTGTPYNNPPYSVRAGGTHGAVHATAPPARRRAPPTRLGAAWNTLLISDFHWLLKDFKWSNIYERSNTGLIPKPSRGSGAVGWGFSSIPVESSGQITSKVVKSPNSFSGATRVSQDLKHAIMTSFSWGSAMDGVAPSAARIFCGAHVACPRAPRCRYRTQPHRRRTM